MATPFGWPGPAPWDPADPPVAVPAEFAGVPAAPAPGAAPAAPAGGVPVADCPPLPGATVNGAENILGWVKSFWSCPT